MIAVRSRIDARERLERPRRWRVKGRSRGGLYEICSVHAWSAEEACAQARRLQPCDGLKLEAWPQ